MNVIMKMLSKDGTSRGTASSLLQELELANISVNHIHEEQYKQINQTCVAMHQNIATPTTPLKPSFPKSTPLLSTPIHSTPATSIQSLIVSNTNHATTVQSTLQNLPLNSSNPNTSTLSTLNNSTVQQPTTPKSAKSSRKSVNSQITDMILNMYK